MTASRPTRHTPPTPGIRCSVQLLLTPSAYNGLHNPVARLVAERSSWLTWLAVVFLAFLPLRHSRRVLPWLTRKWSCALISCWHAFLWREPTAEAKEDSSLFGGVPVESRKSSTLKAAVSLDVPPTSISWASFVARVLPDAVKIEYRLSDAAVLLNSRSALMPRCMIPQTSGQQTPPHAHCSSRHSSIDAASATRCTCERRLRQSLLAHRSSSASWLAAVSPLSPPPHPA